jgi:hypothetical protein
MTAAALHLQHPCPAHHHQWRVVLLMLQIRHQPLQPALRQQLPVLVMTSRVRWLRQLPLLRQLWHLLQLLPAVVGTPPWR